MRAQDVALMRCRTATSGVILPSSFANLAFWGEATTADYLLDAGGATPSDAENVQQITDRSSNLNHAVQTTDAQRAIFVADTGGGIGALQFGHTGVDDRYNLTNNIVLAGDFTLCWTAYVAAGTSTFLGNSADNGSCNVFNATTFRLRDTASTFTFASTGLTLATRVFLLRRSGTAVSLWVDSAASASNPQTVSASWTINRIGSRIASDHLNGFWFNGVIYSQAHSNADCNTFASYLAGRAGKTWTGI